ncbi:unnamed protein product [Moneuplotes crassus]|uniref:Uncharacterized protein n=1 Tax=Euplotes crassus TaxID=5936 RepID=A0AAD2D495_EUPCR|nr:unnamed protein product [Moneuplotes crassus]
MNVEDSSPSAKSLGEYAHLDNQDDLEANTENDEFKRLAEANTYVVEYYHPTSGKRYVGHSPVEEQTTLEFITTICQKLDLPGPYDQYNLCRFNKSGKLKQPLDLNKTILVTPKKEKHKHLALFRKEVETFQIEEAGYKYHKSKRNRRHSFDSNDSNSYHIGDDKVRDAENCCTICLCFCELLQCIAFCCECVSTIGGRD